jgi:hypothetical protein
LRLPKLPDAPDTFVDEYLYEVDIAPDENGEWWVIAVSDDAKAQLRDWPLDA